jgi:thioredoxin 1
LVVRETWLLIIMRYLNLVFIFLLAACSQTNGQNSEVLTPDEFEKKLSTIKDKQVLDVRTAEEFANGHLAQATMIDYYKSDFKLQVAKLDKNKPLFVYCGSGARSESATEILEELGFKKVYDLKGGYRAWKSAGKPITK